MPEESIHYIRTSQIKQKGRSWTRSTKRVVHTFALGLQQLWSPWLLLLVAGVLPGLIVLLYLEIWAATHIQDTCDVLNGVINGQSWDDDGDGSRSAYSFDGRSGSRVARYLAHTSVYNLNIIFGSYSFAFVKAIDVAWDLVVGRGGQFLLGLISFRVLGHAMLTIMESDPVSYELFASISISGSGVLAAAQLVRQLVSRPTWKRASLLFSLALSVAWVLAWPTMMSAMTGYIAKETAFVKLRSGDLALRSNWYATFFANSWMEIYDGQRIGLTKDYILGRQKQPELWNAIYSYTSYVWDDGQDPRFYPPPAPITINSTTYNLTALSPPLNVSQDPINVYNNQIYDRYDGNSLNYTCISSGRYAWGFSAWFLIISATLHGLWCIFMYFIWLYAQRRSQLYRRGRKLGMLRAVSDLGDAMREEIGPGIMALTEKQIKEGLRRNKRGVKYSFEEAGLNDEPLEARLVFVGHERDYEDDKTGSRIETRHV